MYIGSSFNLPMYHIDYFCITIHRCISRYIDVLLHHSDQSNYENNGTFYAYIFGVAKRTAAGLVWENVKNDWVFVKCERRKI